VPELKEMLLRPSKVRHLKHNHVFTYRGVPVKEIKRSFKSACKKAGIEDFRFHDLRHTFITNMRKAGVERGIIMKITGHKTTSMFDRYNTVDQEDALRAMEKLDGYLDVERQKITSYLLQGEAYRYKRPLHNPSLHCDPCHCERSEAISSPFYPRTMNHEL